MTVQNSNYFRIADDAGTIRNTSSDQSRFLSFRRKFGVSAASAESDCDRIDRVGAVSASRSKLIVLVIQILER
jgi:hypothetical protein